MKNVNQLSNSRYRKWRQEEAKKIKQRELDCIISEEQKIYSDISAWKEIISSNRDSILKSMDGLMFDLGLSNNDVIWKNRVRAKEEDRFTQEPFFGIGCFHFNNSRKFFCVALLKPNRKSTDCVIQNSDFMKILHGEQLT